MSVYSTNAGLRHKRLPLNVCLLVYKCLRCLFLYYISYSLETYSFRLDVIFHVIIVKVLIFLMHKEFVANILGSLSAVQCM